jgi:hypothetical protein
MPEAVRVDVIRDAEVANEPIESLMETAQSKASAVRPTDEEFDRFTGLGVDGGGSATPFLANKLDELCSLVVHRDDPFVVELSQGDADGIVLPGFPDQAVTLQGRHLPRSHAGPSSQKECFGPDILLRLESLLEKCIGLRGDGLGEVTIARGEICSSQEIFNSRLGPPPLGDVLQEAPTASDAKTSGGVSERRWTGGEVTEPIFHG